MSGCGYGLRGQSRDFFEKRKIRNLYIPPVKNDSYKAGIEIIVYNQLRKRFAQWVYVKIVDDESRADARLNATVTQATTEPAATIRADQLAPVGEGPSNIEIAASYNVTLGIRFELISAESGVLWQQQATRSKGFQAATFFGALGTTSALINESQSDTTLGELAVIVIQDAEESINTEF